MDSGVLIVENSLKKRNWIATIFMNCINMEMYFLNVPIAAQIFGWKIARKNNKAPHIVEN